MKAFPEAVQKAFPCKDGQVPQKPWWVAFDLKGNLCRTDRFCGNKSEDVDNIDAAYPIPHPGFRAGQIWAAEDGSSVCVTEKRNYEDRFFLWAGNAFWLLDEFANAYPYLIADPACPHLAPWSPVGEK